MKKDMVGVIVHDGSVIKQKLKVSKVCFVSIFDGMCKRMDDHRILCSIPEQVQLSSDKPWRFFAGVIREYDVCSSYCNCLLLNLVEWFFIWL